MQFLNELGLCIKIEYILDHTLNTNELPGIKLTKASFSAQAAHHRMDHQTCFKSTYVSSFPHY